MRIDSHQHFWKYDPLRDSWITDEMLKLKSDFLPMDLKSLLTHHKFDGCVAVQADQSENETKFLLQLAKENSFIKGVVGWVDFQSKDIQNKLYQFSASPLLKGFRHIVQAEPAGFLLNKKFQQGLSYLRDFNLTYDILVKENQLTEVLAFVNEFPDQKFVLDHIGKPAIKTQNIETWKNTINRFSNLQNVFCKLSGLVTEANWLSWKQEDFNPYLDEVVKTFGAERIMYGSDWPVCLLASSYQSQLAIIENYFESFTDSEKEDIFGNNAIRFYDL